MDTMDNPIINVSKHSISEIFEKVLRLSVADGDASPKTTKSYREGLTNFLLWCKTNNLEPMTMTYEHIQGYRNCLASKYKRSTISLRLTAVRLLFKAMQRMGKRTDNPADGIRSPKDKESSCSKVLDKALSQQEATIFLKSLPFSYSPIIARDKAIIYLMIFHGLRAGEIANIEINHLDADSFSVIHIKGKGEKFRTIILSPITRHALLEWNKLRVVYLSKMFHNKLFFNLNNHILSGLTVRSIERVVDYYLAKSNLKKYGRSAHALRHTHAVLAVLGGANREVLAEEMGHVNTRTTDTYLRAASQWQENPSKCIDNLLAQQTL